MEENKIILELESLKEDRILSLSKKLAKTKMPIIGVSLPHIRQLAKKYKTEDFLNIPFHLSLEMDQFLGIWNAYRNIDEDSKLTYLEKLLFGVDSWAATDSIIVTYHLKDKLRVKEKILLWMDSSSIFLNRSAHILFLVHFVKEKEEVKWYLSLIKETGNYYVDMAICWVLATIAILYFDEVMNYLSSLKKDSFLYRNTIRKMKESKRISKEKQEKIRKEKQ